MNTANDEKFYFRKSHHLNRAEKKLRREENVQAR
jgi:hypothetical protein